jgi:shikimate kinase
MDQQRPILLIGYRGTGKSTVARLLAERLGRTAIDADDEVEQHAGKSIAEIFATDGEPEFREIEAAVVEDLCRRLGTVVSLGGGAVLREDNRRTICGAGPVVWLTARLETITARLAEDATTASRRPNLTAAGGHAEIATLLSQREPLYRACATLVVATDDKTSADVADEILAQL